MENKIEQCPECGNYVEGKIVYSEKEKVTRAAASKGVSVYAGAIIGSLVGSIAFPIGTIIGFIAGIYISNTLGKNYAESVGNELFKDADFLFICPKCGKRWTKHLMKNHDSTTLEVLQKELDELRMNIDCQYTNKLRSLIINSVITVFSFGYCCINDATYTTEEDVWLLGRSTVVNYHYLWWFLGLIFLIFLFRTIFKISKVLSLNKIKNDIENMNVEEFRHSSYRNYTN